MNYRLNNLNSPNRIRFNKSYQTRINKTIFILSYLNPLDPHWVAFERFPRYQKIVEYMLDLNLRNYKVIIYP